MKKVLLSIALCVFALLDVSAQLECNQNYSNALDENGEAELLISDLVANIEFMLTQGTVTYYISPYVTGTISAANDIIPLTCKQRGLPYFIVEVESGGALVDNCFGQLVITSPNGGCEGDNPDICGDTPDCLKIVSSYYVTGETEVDVFATQIALCEDALGCDGTYSIAYGLASNGGNLDFSNSISSADANQFKNPITIFYSDASTTVFLQSYLYVWANKECILKSNYATSYELDLTAEAQITPDNFLIGDEECESIGLALTALYDPEPLDYFSSITVDCNHIGQRTVWVRNLETGFTIPKTIQIKDPLEACGTALGPGDRLINYTKGIEGLLFNTEVILNSPSEIDGKILPRHPGGIGWIINEADLIDGANTIYFKSDEFSLNGISTLDIVLGQRIILLDEYDYPWEAVVFDVDQSNYIGIADMIFMREIILGIYNGEGLADAYFFNNSYEFPADFDPFNFENNFTEFTFDKADFETVDFSFEARKVGDVNDNAIPGLVEKGSIQSETRSEDNIYHVTDMEVQAGDEFTFELKYESEEKFKGLLTALIGDGLEFLSLNFEELNDMTPQVDYNVINGNEIRVMYRNNNSVAELNEITFTIAARASKPGELVDLLGLKAGFPHEVIGENNNSKLIEDLGIINSTSVTITGLSTPIDLYPNPAHDRITVSSHDTELRLVMVMDALGRQVMTQIISGNKAELNVSEIPSGLYHMKITTEEGLQAASFIKE